MSEPHPKSLKEAREAAGMTQEQLAPLVGMSRPAISSWEQEQGPRPIGAARLLLAQVFSLPVEVVDSWFSKARAEAA